MKWRQSLQLAVGVLVAVFFLWMVAQHIAWHDVRRLLSQARWPMVALALLAFIAGYACRIARWQAMLRPSNPQIRWRDCAGPLIGSFAANNVLPFRAGDVLRSFAFNRELGASTPAILSTLLAERMLDLLMVLVMLGLGLHAFTLALHQLVGIGSSGLLILAALIVLLLLKPKIFRPMVNLMIGLVGRISPTIQLKAMHITGQVFDTLDSLSRGTLMWRLLGWSGAAWLLEGLVFWSTAFALPGMLHPEAAWLALPIGTLATLIPSTPGYVGTFDFFTARAMTLGGNTTTAATAFALLVHALLWLPPTVAGGLYMLWRSLSPDQKTAS